MAGNGEEGVVCNGGKWSDEPGTAGNGQEGVVCNAGKWSDDPGTAGNGQEGVVCNGGKWLDEPGTAGNGQEGVVRNGGKWPDDDVYWGERLAACGGPRAGSERAAVQRLGTIAVGGRLCGGIVEE
jgi:hypothetical protein